MKINLVCACLHSAKLHMTRSTQVFFEMRWGNSMLTLITFS